VVQSCRRARRRWHLHFTPTSSSWLNLVERFFKDLTDRRLRRGVFSSVPDLVRAMQTWIAARNADPKPVTWTAAADEIIDKVKRGRTSLSRLTPPKTPSPQVTSLTEH